MASNLISSTKNILKGPIYLPSFVCMTYKGSMIMKLIGERNVGGLY